MDDDDDGTLFSVNFNMAETVKKSRIVSEDDQNMEEALLEEFNLRLKNCMSSDDLQTAVAEEDVEIPPENIYENVTSTRSSPPSSTKIASNDFILNERECYYDTPRVLTISGHSTPVSKPPNHYESLEAMKKTEEADQYVDMEQHVEVSPKIEIEHINHEDCEMNSTESEIDERSYEFVEAEEPEKPSPEDAAKSVKDRMFLATDDAAATLLFTQTVTSPMLTPSEENIDFLKGFQTEPITETPADKSSEENSTASDPLADGGRENIYENTEFLKNRPANIYENLQDIQKDEPLYQNLPAVENENVEEHIYQDIEDCNEEEEEAIYESLDDVKHQKAVQEEVIVENQFYSKLDEFQKSDMTTDLDMQEEHNENYEVIKTTETVEISKSKNSIEERQVVENLSEIVENQSQKVESNTEVTDSNNQVLQEAIKESYSEFIHHSKTESNYYEKYTEVVSKNADVIANREKDTESVPAEIVKNLKNQFSKTTGVEVVAATTKKEVSDASRVANIMKQINKFEHKEAADGTLADLNESAVTESYIETTIQSTEGLAEKGLKKKKSKKSRKEEKENISVNGLDVVNLENVYNVNVKNLCRSFGDLTKMPDNQFHHDRQIKSSARTKSLSDVLLSSNKKTIENVFSEVSVRALKEKFNIVENKNPLGIVKTSFKNLKSSFNKFDALQKKNLLHIRSSDSAKAQEKFNGSQQMDTTNCKACSKQVFQMEQIKAEKAIWHKNCFRCTECSKQLTVETYASHEGNLYCKPHFKSLFAPKAVEDETPPRSRKPELIIRENQPLELPPDVVRASDKPDLGLEELQCLNVKERFQVFEHHQTELLDSERGMAPINVKRSPSILSKLARFQAKGMDVGVSDDALNGIPIEESSSEEEQEEEEVPEGEDPTLFRARKAQKEKPFHFTNINEVKNKWEHGDKNAREERREERKQEIQSFRNKLFMGKQGKMKEAYQQAVMQSESCSNLNKAEKIESCDTKSLKERFEKGQSYNDKEEKSDNDEDSEVFQSEISKKSRSLFLELDAHASKPPQISPITPPKVDVRKARETFLAKMASEDTVKSSEVEDMVEVKTADIQQRFKFFETYKEPEKERKQFRITPPRDPSQVKTETPEREIYHDPDVVRAESYVDDSVIAKTTHTASKMLNKFRQMEENLSKDPEPVGPKPLKRFTPPPEPTRQESSSGEEESGSEEESEEDDQTDNQKLPEDLIEAQKAARAKQLRAKFEKWEAQEIKREQTQAVNIVEEYGEESQVESTKALRARFEQLRDTNTESAKTPRVKVNRFVEIPRITEACESCDGRVYPLEKITVHGHIYHKNCFKCMECSSVLRMDSYSYNQGLLYCIPHFKRLFISKGNYDSAFGLNGHKEKWNVNATMA